MITAPGLYPDIEPTDYFAGFTPAPALSNSIMQILLDGTPQEAAFAHPMLNPDPEIRKANAAMRQGDVVHQLALGKGRGYKVIDAKDFKTKAAQDERDQAIEDGLTPVTKAKFAEAEKMADILRDRIATILIGIGQKRGLVAPKGGWNYHTEVVIAWQEKTPHGLVWCQGMLDVWCPDLLVALDPKITSRLTNKRVRGHMENQGWDRQGYWYERGLSAIMPEHSGRITFADMMVHPKAPHVFRAVGITSAWRAAIEADVNRALDTFGHCLSFGAWPGYDAGIEELEPTPWKLKAALEAEMDDEEEEE